MKYIYIFFFNFFFFFFQNTTAPKDLAALVILAKIKYKIKINKNSRYTSFGRNMRQPCMEFYFIWCSVSTSVLSLCIWSGLCSRAEEAFHNV